MRSACFRCWNSRALHQTTSSIARVRDLPCGTSRADGARACRIRKISIRRGRLRRLLYDAIEARAPGGVHVDRTFMSWHETGGQVEAHFVSASGERFAAKGDILIGADGVHSQLRRILFPDEDMPRWSGRLMWRGTA